MEKDFYRQVYDLVRKIPPGKVATYGQIAALLAAPRAARTVGYALNALRRGSVFPPVPWQRVINYRGMISLPPGGGYEIQRDLLTDEGVTPDEDGVYDLNEYLWNCKLEESAPEITSP
ncbi:MAG: MGMT family protein [candidate division Zixibacteria bacterium]|nr:MGMT family protein [Candidatus Tariuqbacter arcticus]